VSIPIDPGQVSGGATRGRRDPRLIRTPDPSPQQMRVSRDVEPEQLQHPQALSVTPDGDVDARGVPELAPGYLTVLPGDVVAGSTTIAIDFGTGGTSFIRYEHRTTVQPGEEEIDVYARVATTVNNGVINLADDVDDRLSQREAEQAERASQLPR